MLYFSMSMIGQLHCSGKDKESQMTLIELQDILGERIKITLKEMETEERIVENEQTALIIETAKQMINNGDLILRTEKLAAQAKNLKESYAMRLITG